MEIEEENKVFNEQQIAQTANKCMYVYKKGKFKNHVCFKDRLKGSTVLCKKHFIWIETFYNKLTGQPDKPIDLN